MESNFKKTGVPSGKLKTPRPRRVPPKTLTKVSSTNEKTTTPPIKPTRKGASVQGKTKKIGGVSVVLIILTLLFSVTSLFFWKKKMDVEKKLNAEKEQLIKKFEAIKMNLNKVSQEKTALQDSLKVESDKVASYLLELKKSKSTIKSLKRYKNIYFRAKRETAMVIKANDSLVKIIVDLTSQRDKLAEQLKDNIAANDSLKNRLLMLSKKLNETSGAITSAISDARKLASSNIKISNITLKAVGRKKGREIDVSVKKSKQLKVCFTVDENELLTTGIQKIYVKLTGPKGQVVNAMDGGKYSNEKKFYYNQESIDVCVYVVKKTKKKLKSGNFSLSILDSNMNELSSQKISLK